MVLASQKPDEPSKTTGLDLSRLRKSTPEQFV
jgi:hypothetical protein